MKISRGGFAIRIPFAKKVAPLPFLSENARSTGLLTARGGEKIGGRVVIWPKFRCLRRYLSGPVNGHFHSLVTVALDV